MSFEKFGKYIFLKKLAVGGMAEIFLAKTEKIAGVSQFVVVKRVLPQFSSNKNFLDMFKNEGRVTSHLKHSNLVYIHEFGVHEGSYFIAMEYVSGCSLKDLMLEVKKKCPRFPTACAVYIIRSIASALYYIHNSVNPETGTPLNIIHRDISPHNIMVGFNGDVKLIDFGIAKVEDTNLTSSGVVKGKFSYMSPEQIRGKTLDHRSDIFSLGAVLWELLSGKKLFKGANINAVVEKVRECQIPNLTAVRSNISETLNQIVQTSLNKDLKARYQNAEDMERQLGIFLNDKYRSFSSLDFQIFVKNLYEEKILKEQKNIIEISKKLKNVKWGEQYNSQIDFSSKQFPVQKQQLAIKEEEKAVSPLQPSKTVPNTLNKKQEIPKKKKQKKTNLMNEATVLSKQAPMSFSRTNPVNRTSLKVKNESVQSQNQDFMMNTSSFSIMKRNYEKRKKINLVTKVFICLGVFSLGIFVVIRYLDSMDTTEYPIVSEMGFSKETPPVVEKQKTQPPVPVVKKEPPKKKGRSPVSIVYDRIFVETVPSGGEAILNGQKIPGRTPMMINFPKNRRNTLEIVKEGYNRYILRDFSGSTNLQIHLKRHQSF